jgi:hypothetical protein
MVERLALTMRGGVSNLPHPVAGADKPRKTTEGARRAAGSFFSIFRLPGNRQRARIRAEITGFAVRPLIARNEHSGFR